MVRSKVELKCIEDIQKRRVCFSKRRAGLMKKARELSVLCDAEVGVIVFSSTGRLYEFATSSMPQIIRRHNRFTGPSLSSSSSPSSTPSPSRAQPDVSHFLAQQAEEIRSLKEEVMMLETENMSLVKEVEHLSLRQQPICYENANLETTLTLRPPSSNAGLGLRMEMPKKEFGSTSKMQM